MKKVYAVGVMQIDLVKGYIKSERLWSLYANFDEAEQAVLENHGDIFEYYYNYALIEEIWVHDSTDIPSTEEAKDFFSPREWWYQATYHATSEQGQYIDPTISKVDKPKCLDKTVYFWVG